MRPRPCACDACRTQILPGDAVTPEGYCAFCARSCYPAMTGPGGPMGRASLDAASRVRMHALQASYGTTDAGAIRRMAAQKVGSAAAELGLRVLKRKLPPGWRAAAEVLGSVLRPDKR